MHYPTLRSTIRFLAAIALVLLLPGIARAACSFSVTNLDFGTVNLLGATTRDSSATVSISCTNPGVLSLTYRICLNLNAGSAGTAGSARKLINGTSAVTYGMFRDAGRTTPWGSTTSPALGSPPQVNLLVLPGTTSTATQVIYGRISGPQSSATGGLHTSLFSGAIGANFTYAALAVLTPCSSITQNPTRPEFRVQASVDRTCNVAAQTLNFGTHGVLSSIVDGASSLTVTCSTGLPYAIALDNGQTGTAPDRRAMTRNGRSIVYGLYRDAARTAIWGSGTGQTRSAVGTGAAQAYPVFGRIQPQDTPPAGVYNDTVVVTLTY